MTIGKCYAFTDSPAFEELNERERKFSIRSGRLLRHIREARNLSMKQLAMAANISHQQIYKYETGQNRLSLCRLETLLRKLAYSPKAFCAQLWPDINGLTVERDILNSKHIDSALLKAIDELKVCQKTDLHKIICSLLCVS